MIRFRSGRMKDWGFGFAVGDGIVVGAFKVCVRIYFYHWFYEFVMGDLRRKR
jgi:hypothetical protein